jgi:hypothetical protein
MLCNEEDYNCVVLSFFITTGIGTDYIKGTLTIILRSGLLVWSTKSTIRENNIVIIIIK